MIWGLLSVGVLLAILVAGEFYPGAWLAGVFLTYEAGAVAHLSWLGTAYVVTAVALSLWRFANHLRPVYLHRSDALTLALAMLLTTSTMWSKDPEASSIMLGQFWMSLVGTFMLARLATGDPRKIVKQLVVTLAVASTVLAPALLATRASGSYAATHRLLIENSDASAVGLTMAIPFGLLASVLMVLAFTELRARIIGIVCLVALSYLAVIAGTRGVFLSAFLAFLAAFALLQTRRMAVRNVLFGLAAVLALFFFFADVSANTLEGPIARLTALFGSGGIHTDPSSLARVRLFGITFKLINEYPALGIGYGAFGRYAFPPYPHNLFLELTVSAGVLGLAVGVLWLLFHASDLMFIFRRQRQEGVFLIALSLVAILQLQVSFPFYAAKPLFLLIALAAAVHDGVLLKRRPKQGVSRPAAAFPKAKAAI